MTANWQKDLSCLPNAATEVSRAFIPPCTGGWTAGGNSRTRHSRSEIGTLAANSACYQAIGVPKKKAF